MVGRLIQKIKPETRALLVISVLIAIPVKLGAYKFPSVFLLLIGTIIWADVRKKQNLNPYSWRGSFRVMLRNVWLIFLFAYALWILTPIFERW